MMKIKQSLALTLAALTVSGNALAYTADGYLNDWLVGAQLTNATDVNSNVGIFTNDNTSPNQYGGQVYDTEYLLADVDWSTKTLHVAVVTGVAPSFGSTDYPDGSAEWRPGDLAIYTGSNYTGDGFWKVQDTNNPADGTTNSLGWTTDNDPGSYTHQVDTARNPDVYGVYIPDLLDSTGTNNGDTGHAAVNRAVQKNAVWFTNNQGGEFRPTSMANSGDQRDLGTNGSGDGDNVGDVVGNAQVAYTSAAYDASTGISFPESSGSHYVVEAAIALTSLGWTEGDDTFNVALQWTMNCANDWISGSGAFFNDNPGGGSNNPVPEPGLAALLVLGLAGVGYRSRKRAGQRSWQ